MDGADDRWVCVECGAENEDSSTCQRCFQTRPEAPATVAGPAEELARVSMVARPRRRPFPLVAGLVVLAAAGVAVYLLFMAGDSGSSHPKAWDPRVADLVTFVEDERDLRFEHPVQIEFMEIGEFQKLLRADETKLSAADRREISDATAMLRALGLIDRDVDLLKSFTDIQSNGTLAYYSFEDERIRVRGKVLTPGVRATVAHELTHALQDQHFDLERIQVEADEGDDDQEGDVLRGLAEGDATRIGAAYKESLSDADRQSADDEEAEDVDSFDVDQYPPVLTALIGAPYALGEQLVGLIDTEKGSAGIDAVFVNPPRFDKSLLDPLGYLDGEKGKALEPPTLLEGEKEIDHGGFGAFSLYLVLAQRIDMKKAMTAADVWGGDAYVAYRSAGRVCVRTAFQGDDAHGTDAIAAALGDWAGPATGGTASVKRTGTTVLFQACDAEDAAVVAGEVTVADLFALPVIRAQIGQLVLDGGGNVRQARCYAGRAIEAFTLEQLQADELPPAEMQRVEEIAASCRDA